MTSAIKLLVFKGAGSEDLEQFWFIVRAVWEAHGVTNDNIKKATLVSVLQDHALTWYIKYLSDHPNTRIVEIWEALKKEFSQPRSKMELIIGFKEIVMFPGETTWDLYQRLKIMI